MEDAMQGRGRTNSKVWLWGVAFVAAMFGAGIFARVVNLNAFWSMAIMIPPMLLLVPFLRSAQQHGKALGCSSRALVRYNRRSLIWSFAYVAALFVTITVKSQFDPKGVLLWLIAILPVLPIGYFVYTLHAYLREEDDEYLKKHFVEQALWGLGALLLLATLWGFLESFDLVPHAHGWLALPVWALGMGVAGIWNRFRKL